MPLPDKAVQKNIVQVYSLLWYSCKIKVCFFDASGKENVNTFTRFITIKLVAILRVELYLDRRLNSENRMLQTKKLHGTQTGSDIW